MPQGDRLAAVRRLAVSGIVYTHYGIDIGDGTVVHARPDRSEKLFAGGRVMQTSLEEFAGGSSVRIVNQPPATFPPEEVALRALRYVGRNGYSPFIDNCEHFATWCATGSRHSRQVEIVVDRVGRVASRTLAAVATRAGAEGLGQVAMRTALGTTVRVGLRHMLPAVLVAEGVAMTVEWNAHRAGRDEFTSKRAGESAGLATSAAIFAVAGAMAGPAGAIAGALTGAAIWSGGSTLSKAAIWAFPTWARLQRALSPTKKV